MNFKNRAKCSGFSLMEILIAVAIVAILALATLPVINRQLNKAEEYSYYLAYNTVEKLAGQIVALGDPEDDVTSYKYPEHLIAKLSKEEQAKKYRTNKTKTNPISGLVASIADKFTNTQAYILSRFVPKAIAANTVTEDWGSFDSDTYDELWIAYQVCANNKQIPISEGTNTVTTIDPETGEEVEVSTSTSTFYEPKHFNDCYGYTLAGQGLEVNSIFIESMFGGATNEKYLFCGSNIVGLINGLKSQNDKPNAKSFCTSTYLSYCGGTKTISGTRHTVKVRYELLDTSFDSEEDVSDEDLDASEQMGEGEEMQDVPVSEEPGSCYVLSDFTVEVSDTDATQYEAQKPEFPTGWCTSNGYINMNNNGAPDTIDCQCKSGYELSVNDERICLSSCPNPGELPYAMKNTSTGAYTGKKCCTTDFNPTNNTCCPVKSLYEPSTQKCVCVSGYKLNSAGTECELEFCPAGSHKTDDGICVVNPPITQAKRFCELITEHWNISDSYCGSFDSNVETQDTYVDVYNAALGNNNKYLSVNSKIGAFKSIKPNIEFANGLKMWILGDKAASIPALSFYSEPISKTQNMCFRKQLTDNTKLGCYYANGYFCQHENTCLVLDPASAASGGIKDARTCCAAVDFSDLEAEAIAAGKNWREDPRAYAVPGFTVFVDINGDKGDGTLWDDVYPFFIGANGEVYPGYPLDAPKAAGSAHDLLYDGGNSEKFLPVDVYYYMPTDDARQRKTAFSGVSYARGVCSARKVSKFAPYCLNLGQKFNGGDGFTSVNCPTSGGCTSSKNLVGNEYIQVDGKESRNPCDHYNCFVAVRKKLKSF